MSTEHITRLEKGQHSASTSIRILQYTVNVLRGCTGRGRHANISQLEYWKIGNDWFFRYTLNDTRVELEGQLDYAPAPAIGSDLKEKKHILRLASSKVFPYVEFLYNKKTGVLAYKRYTVSMTQAEARASMAELRDEIRL